MKKGNVAVVEEFVEAVNTGDVDRILDQIDSEDFEIDYSRARNPDQKGIHRGREQTRVFLEGLFAPWEEFGLFVTEYIEVGENVVVVGEFQARGEGSGVDVVGRGTLLYEFSDGSLVAVRQFQTKSEALAVVGE